MSKLISTLEQLHLLRTRAVEDLSTKLASQNQLCQRFEKNIDTLTSLAAGLVSQSANSAAMMINQSKYKHNIQRIIDWQKQEQALARLEAQKIQGNLLAEAKREKSIELVLDAKRADRQAEINRREQKMTDSLSAQCWLRQQRLIRQR
ncbi:MULTISPECIES: flagellar export protein FliJ [Citrobacter]|uniref:flagellar export protein FliJ n=1 Tax=Citrobacter TaxID=544 RepID=UPI0008DE5814|nr:MULTISPECIES: flagellar export protein FliJ [Citrobacter]MBE0025377.1 flagellar export protein FliJ [Citrobacter koseri]MBE0080958.1 flagellar export protein FliJ [Citrobacter koseri]MBJ8670835.1 flagellar export protein FliJ [Citrobacter koseri]MBJ8762324.1 flagellar export protein FliJ [Citrobacter koseri]MBJ8811867.1 flagellar export protein FliJ [Citrobacter koseri]